MKARVREMNTDEHGLIRPMSTDEHALSSMKSSSVLFRVIPCFSVALSSVFSVAQAGRPEQPLKNTDVQPRRNTEERESLATDEHR